MTTDLIVSRLRAAGCVFAEDEARLLIESAETPAALDAMVGRRIAGLPLEHIVGWVEFLGMRFAVDPGVFVPRKRTEFLAVQAIQLASPGDVVVDLCCGSGAVGAAIAAAVPGVALSASDIEPAAVRCARRNVVGPVYLGDLYAPLPDGLRGRVAVVVANAPYVPTRAVSLLPPEARIYEPMVALDGGEDGMAVLRRVTEGAPEWLAPGGHLLFETSVAQSAAAVEWVARVGLTPRVATDEEIGATVVIGTRG
jgi:release factor glutamine methyltransferase